MILIIRYKSINLISFLSNKNVNLLTWFHWNVWHVTFFLTCGVRGTHEKTPGWLTPIGHSSSCSSGFASSMGKTSVTTCGATWNSIHFLLHYPLWMHAGDTKFVSPAWILLIGFEFCWGDEAGSRKSLAARAKILSSNVHNIIQCKMFTNLRFCFWSVKDDLEN